VSERASDHLFLREGSAPKPEMPVPERVNLSTQMGGVNCQEAPAPAGPATAARPVVSAPP
jgi:hypothetical protein